MTSAQRRFADRHIGTDAAAQRTMLDALGYDSVDGLVRAAVPTSIQTTARETTDIPRAATEAEALAELRALASMNRAARPMIGLGFYDTFTPSVIARNVLENPSWYTAYTPYQPEISQGRLEALINFQTMVSDLTGLDTANASMLDESTAVVEGMLLARRASKSASNVFAVDADALPQTKALLRTRAGAVGITLVEVDFAHGGTIPVEVDGEKVDPFGVFVQYPGASGRVWDPSGVIDAVHVSGGLAIVAADLLALTLLRSPGSLGADVAVGTTQRFGVPLGFGGPHAGYMAVRQGLERQLPGRLVGVSQDAEGHPAYRLALQTREQHIRREKATSNICTSQVLLAVMASMYAVYHGPEGLREIATDVAKKAEALAERLREYGLSLVSDSFFDTIRVVTPGPSKRVIDRARSRGYQLFWADDATVGVSVDETTTADDLAAVAWAFGLPDAEFDGAGEEGERAVPFEEAVPLAGVPEVLRREDDYLTHPVFHTHRSETAMMRYLKTLSDRDYALDRGMIPLGSCTMKLNAATEMAAVSWPEFARVHPFAPEADVRGYLAMIEQLETWLAEVTGYDAVSLQPNAGSQGELAGLLAIRGYHDANGEPERRVCLIPSSAHGTNAASAVLAGLRVVVVACDDQGNVDLDDLRAKVDRHRDELAALMITYPSTHGVYEHDVLEITSAVHDAGGQVYVDGANLNALLGYSRFGDLGGDVSHLNLHKTFAIPHGGGGPGVGPVAAKAHLAPFLPGHPFSQRKDHAGGVFQGGPVSAAPHGSAGILPISWAYVRMMGTEGLTDATAAAVLAANYLATRLREHFPVLYTGDNGLVAHECILDLRPLKEQTGITVDDVAKRLIDYGFHAPTMSFPVAGTLMVEPTESEDLGELERFVEAMIAIKNEALAVAAGEWPKDDNPLVNAPHTAASVVADEWTHPYSRERAVFPVPSLVRNKYWPPVRRIDQAWGDRNLVCACPPIEAFA
ncbi:MAG TPA: aminomethyl-transferring glycine dehydrogenase [Microbacterium sp.]|nr:aminomethyl-transferring glycine dehydrogenase [Microbacterium sp.]HWL77134.1 aminomethyl-transferring glycine dehydrogenase [Microbacterium sp.]